MESQQNKPAQEKQHESGTQEGEQKPQGIQREAPLSKPVLSGQGSTGGSGDTQQQKKKKKFWKEWEPIEKFNFLLVIFTAVYALISFGQLWTMRQTQQLDFRALPAPHALEIATFAENEKIRVKMTLENKGRLPAQEVTVRAKIVVATSTPQWTNLKDPYGVSQQQSFCFVGTLIEGIPAFCVFADDEAIPPETFTAITAFHQTFVVYTYIEYRDELMRKSDPPRSLLRCELYFPASKQFVQCPLSPPPDRKHTREKNK